MYFRSMWGRVEMEVNAEVHFAQRLASNEKKQRDKAIKKLRKYIGAKSRVGFTEDDYLKIWKGLHYCMWMQDKPVIQEELSVNITRLVHILKNHKQALLFIKVFFKTETREWGGIDFWRVDKFMMFVRDMLRESFVYLKNLNWDAAVVKEFVAIVNETLLDCSNEDIPDGIRTHLADIYLAELSKVGADQLSSSQIVDFLAPFITYIQRSKKIHIVNRVISGVFYPVISQTTERIRKEKEKENRMVKGENGEEISETKEEGDEEEDDSMNDDSDDGDDELIGKTKLHLKYDCHEIADKLFEAGSRSDCSSHNRKIIYKLVKRLRNAADGVLPRLPHGVVDTKVGLKEINRAVQALQSTEMRYLKKNEKAKKKYNKVKNIEDREPVIQKTGIEETVLLPNGKRKKSAYETLHAKKAKTEDRSQCDNLPNKPVADQNDKGENKKKKQKKNKNISHEKEDEHVNVDGTEIVFGKKKKKRNQIIKLDVDDSEKVQKADADSTNGINYSSVTNEGKKKKKHGEMMAEKPSCLANSDEDLSDKAVKSSTNKKDISDENNKDFSTDSEGNLKSDTQELSSSLDNGAKLSSVKKKKKALKEIATSSSKKKLEDSATQENDEKNNVLSSKKKKKKEEPVLKNSGVEASLHSQSDDGNLETSSNKKKKNNKTEIIPDSTVDSESKNNNLDSSVFRSETNKNEDVLPDSTIDSEKTLIVSDKCTKIKKKSSLANVEEEVSEPSIVRNLMDDFLKPLEEGEIEIFVPSKKWARKQKCSESMSEENTILSESPDLENEEKTTLSESPQFEKEEKKIASVTPKSERKKKSLSGTPKSVKQGKITADGTPKSSKKGKITAAGTPKSVKQGKITPAGTPFAKFEISQTPVAFVRKASTPQTEPRKRKLEHATEAPDQCLSVGRKRVSFDPSRNQSRDIKDSLKDISDPAFQPDKTPTQGILKSPVVTSSGKKLKKQSKKVVIKNTICNSRTSFTPISQNRMLTRARAADFF